MKINVWIGDSGSSAIFSVDTKTGDVNIEDTGGMPVEKLIGRVKSWNGSPMQIKKRLEHAWNCDCVSADIDPYVAEITDDNGNFLS